METLVIIGFFALIILQELMLLTSYSKSVEVQNQLKYLNWLIKKILIWASKNQLPILLWICYERNRVGFKKNIDF